MAETPDYVKEFWEDFGIADRLVEIECDDAAAGGSLAVHVLDTFNVPVATSSARVGGNLKDLDIKRMDAIAVINLSLLEATAREGLSDGKIYEVTINSDGEAEFIVIGGSYASLTDIYYQVQSDNYREECVGVLLHGGSNMPEWLPLDWKPIWGEGNDSSRVVYDLTRVTVNCMLSNYSTHALITYNDPNLDSTYQDGINNLYEITDPFVKINGYVNFIHAPGATDDTQIDQQNTSTVPIQIGLTGSDGNGPYMGKLLPRPSAEEGAENYADCWAGTSVAQSVDLQNDAVKVEIPEKMRYTDIRNRVVDKLLKVDKIIIIGQELSLVHTGAISPEAAAQEDPSEDNTQTIIEMNNISMGMYELDEGKHYIVKYTKDDAGYKVPYIVFAKDARVNEPKAYGMGSKYKYAITGQSGYYTPEEEGVGTIFPIAENKGYLVDQIWALVTFDSPSISVYDPAFNDVSDTGVPIDNTSLANEIADNLEYVIAPIMVEERPAPIVFSKGFGAEVVDQVASQQDNDPTTVQNFTDTPLELIYDELAGGAGLEITLPFFKDEDEDAMLELASNLWHILDEDYVETTYVCGPNTEVSLGEKGPAGGIINNISYSYSDQGSYTISVNEGSKIMSNFSGGGPTGPSFKATESLNMRGTIIESIGNGMFFKVRIDGFGVRVAVNMSSEFLRAGDVVSCSIHNNPVED